MEGLKDSQKVDIDLFKAYVPINKTASSDSEWYISGVASTNTKDWDGEIVDPSTLDITYLMKQGKINYEHNNELDHIIGEPTDNTYIDKSGLHLEAMLYKNMPLAQDAWKLANAMEKSHAKRSLGFSIEGIGKRSADPNVFSKVKVMNVAITANPANPDASWKTFKKSVDVNSELAKAYSEMSAENPAETGTEINPSDMQGVSSFRKEDLPGALTTLTYAMKSENCSELLNYAQKALEDSGNITKDVKQLILQVGRGVSKETAKNFLDE